MHPAILASIVIASVLGVVGIVGALHRLLHRLFQWRRGNSPWNMTIVTKDIHSPIGDIGGSDSLTVNPLDRAEFTVRLEAETQTSFRKVSIRPKLRDCKPHRWSAWEWKNVDANCGTKVLGLADLTSQREEQEIRVDPKKDDRCGMYLIYSPPISVIAGNRLNLRVEMAIPEPWSGYLELYSDPPAGRRQIAHRRLRVKGDAAGKESNHEINQE